MQRYSNWAIVSDYDGTLTTGIGNSISEQNIFAIKRFVYEGGKFCIATGRAGFEIDGLMGNSVVFNLPCAFYDGSLIFDYVSQKAIYQKPLPMGYKELLAVLIEEFKDVQIFVGNADRLSLVNAPGYSYEAARDAVICSKGKVSDENEILDFINRVSILRPWDVIEPLEKADEIAYKLLFCSSNARISDLEARIAELDINNEYKVVKPFSFNLEVVSRGGGKETALKWIRDNCFCGNVLAIGDGHNDAEMFEVADYSLAPELAHPDAKKAATLIGGSCETIVSQALEVIDGLSARRCSKGESMVNEQPRLGKIQSR